MTEIGMSTYIRIARNLREFGYSGVSGTMVQEVHEAMRSGAEIPHDVVGMFAKAQIEEVEADARA